MQKQTEDVSEGCLKPHPPSPTTPPVIKHLTFSGPEHTDPNPTYKPCFMIWNISVNNEEHPGTRWLPPPPPPSEKDSWLNGSLCSHKGDHCVWPCWTADVLLAFSINILRVAYGVVLWWRCQTLMLRPYLFMQNADCCRAKRLSRAVLKFSQMFVRRFYLAVRKTVCMGFCFVFFSRQYRRNIQNKCDISCSGDVNGRVKVITSKRSFTLASLNQLNPSQWWMYSERWWQQFSAHNSDCWALRAWS